MTAKYHPSIYTSGQVPVLPSFSWRVKQDSTGNEVTGGAAGVAWESRTSPVISESSSEKDCFLRFRTWLELMQLRINNERAVVILLKDISYGMSFIYAWRNQLIGGRSWPPSIILQYTSIRSFIIVINLCLTGILQIKLHLPGQLKRIQSKIRIFCDNWKK